MKVNNFQYIQREMREMLNYFLIRATGITSINYKIKKFSFQKMEQCKTNVSNYILCADNKK